MKKKIRIKVNAFRIVSNALDAAIERGMNRCDKYNPEPLTEGQRRVLETEVVNSFWTALEDAGAEI